MTTAVHRTLLALATLSTLWRPAFAQKPPRAQQALRYAIAVLDSAETERGTALLRELLASLLASVPRDLRVSAHLYLAEASWALKLKDSVTAHLREVVQHDPFFVLDPQMFNPDLVTAHRYARLKTVAVRLRVPIDTTLDPMRERLPIAVAVGQPGEVRIRLRSTTPRLRDSLLATVAVDNIVTISIPLLRSDSIALDPGSYALEGEVVTPGGGTARDLLDVAIERTPVDTAQHEPPIPTPQFRSESGKRAPSLAGVARGLGLGMAASALPVLFGNGQLSDDFVPTSALALGITIAVADIWFGRPARPIPANVAHNRSLRTTWEARNRAIAADNERRRRRAPLRIRIGSN